MTDEEINQLAMEIEKTIAENQKILDECDFDPKYRRISEAKDTKLF